MESTSVLIPNFNGSAKVVCLLQILLPQLKDDDEVVIIDDGSTDTSVEIIEAQISNFNKVKLISQPNQGRSGARNKGVHHSKGDFLIFLDNDIIPDSSFLARMKYVHSIKPSAWITGAVAQSVIDCPQRDFLEFRQRFDCFTSEGESDEFGLYEVKSFSTAQLGIDRNSFDRIGGFNPFLLDCEDFELSTRVIDSGGVIVYDPFNVVLYADYAGPNQFIRRQIEYRRGRDALKLLRPELAERFPELFPNLLGMPLYKRYLRAFFRHNFLWNHFLESRIFSFLPRRFRHIIFDWVISSSFLLSSGGHNE